MPSAFFVLENWQFGRFYKPCGYIIGIFYCVQPIFRKNKGKREFFLGFLLVDFSKKGYI